MAPSRRTLSIILALLVATSFMVTGYVLSSPWNASFVSALSSEEVLREYAKKDTDADGLPDWQEELYGADPSNPRSLDPEKTDKEVVDAGGVAPRFTSEKPAFTYATDEELGLSSSAAAPGSVTDEFAKTFFQVYVEAGGANAVNDASLQDRLLNELSAKAANQLSSAYGAGTVRSSASATVSEYLSAVERIFDAHQVPAGSDDPVALIDAYITRGDTSAQPKLETLAASYRGTAAALAALEVPVAVSTAHLTLLRSFDLLGAATEAVAAHERDPLATVPAIGLYTPVAQDLRDALVAIGNVVSPSEVPALGMPGSRLMDVIRAAATP